MVELSDALYQGPAKQNGAFIQENKKIHNKNQPTYQQKTTTTKPTKQQQTINKKNPNPTPNSPFTKGLHYFYLCLEVLFLKAREIAWKCEMKGKEGAAMIGLGQHWAEGSGGLREWAEGRRHRVLWDRMVTHRSPPSKHCSHSLHWTCQGKAIAILLNLLTMPLTNKVVLWGCHVPCSSPEAADDLDGQMAPGVC